MAILLKLVLLVVGVSVVGAGAIAVMVVTGDPGECGAGRSVSVSPATGQQVESSLRALYDGGGGTLAMNESEASSLATNHAGGLVRGLKVCFEEGVWQASGAIALRELARAGVGIPEFLQDRQVQVLMSGGIGFAGRRAVATSFNVRVGSVPEFVSGLVEPFLRSYVNDRLAEADVSRSTSVQFSRTRATVTVR